MLMMLIAELGGCLPAASMQSLLAVGNQPRGSGLLARFAQTAKATDIQDAALVAVVEAFHEAA
ncbi:hypothetical protein J7432_09385 [Xanthomonas axonopodis pv. begoniae]|uniref:hypothetical protein n=1 Tax=Xanthomonas phaseoli TaxID=1985254 RepID=UPI0015E41997|nr:hypothetical protein [Xanthomonas phaseoli]MBO9739228.1 hypothetical protein [Xanthomonas axonopodis pv. begoniae]MBO9772993.1 hypothetical protein [Xanthomonas axonopodis pv. begoniae]MCC8468912.1 hypothetical protein [Xanthomonas phaseoli]